MSGRQRRPLTSLAVLLLVSAAGADPTAFPGCCGARPEWTVGVEFGLTGVKTEEIVEALPASAAQDLSRLTWEVPAGVAGVRVSYRTRGRLRLNGGVWYLVDAGGGTLVNLDYLDAASDVATHRSVSPSDLRGAGWELSADVMLVEDRSAEMFLRSFVRLGYRGAYHEWSARGGEYEYPGRQGQFADEEIIRYLVLHQVFDVGGFVELGQTGEGLYGRLGGAVSLWSHVDDRDTHLLSDTEYYNTYRRGWHVRPEIALGVRFEGGGAVEVIYEPAWQFAFAETATKVRTGSGVYLPEENPNYTMKLHRVGIRVAWA